MRMTMKMLMIAAEMERKQANKQLVVEVEKNLTRKE
jgi:hypothetical protein